MRRKLLFAPLLALLTGAAVAGMPAMAAVPPPASATPGAGGPATTGPARFPGEWTQAGADAGWSRYQPDTGGLTRGLATALRVRWQRDVVDRPSGAALAGGRLWIGTTGGWIHALDPATGEPRARFLPAPGRQIQQLAVLDGTVYVHTSSPLEVTRHYLAAYGTDGKQRWEIGLPAGDTVSRFVIDHGRIALTTGPVCHDPCTAYDVRVFRADTGEQLWRSPTGGDTRNVPPAIVSDTLYQATEVPVNGLDGGSMVVAYDLATGQRRWSRAAGSGTAVADGAGYTVGTAGLCSFRSSDGTPRWCTPGEGRGTGPVSVSPSVVVTNDLSQVQLIGLHPGTGRQRWWARFSRDDAARGEVSLPVVLGGDAAYGLAEYHDATNHRQYAEVIALDAATGTVLRRVALPTDFGAAQQLLLGAGHLYLLSDTGVWALG